jgi:hypothetical protein
MSTRERTFLVLSILAFLLANTLAIAYLLRHGFSAHAYLFICGRVFIPWSLWEGRRLQMRAWWAAIPATLLVGLCFAIPLFLFFRERALRRAARARLLSPLASAKGNTAARAPHALRVQDPADSQ